MTLTMLRLLSGSRRSLPPLRSDRPDDLSRVASSVVQGDPMALRTFLAAIVPRLLRVARRVLGPHHPDVEDVAYEAAYEVVESLARFRGEGTVLHFACRVGVLTLRPSLEPHSSSEHHVA